MSRQQVKDKAKLIEKLANTPIVEVACKQVGLPRATYYRWRKEDEAFAEACDEAIEQSAALINDLAEAQLISAIKEKNITAILYWLKHRHPAYAARLQIEASVHHEPQELTPEQEVAVRQAFRNAGFLPAEQLGTKDE